MKNTTNVTYVMGHPVTFIDGEWYIVTTGERYWDEEVFKNLKCVKCGLRATEEGHDPCIANLPDVKYACCGHGVVGKYGAQYAYIMYENGSVIRFDKTEELLKHVGR